MANKETNGFTDMFEYYSSAYKAGLDMFNSWSKMNSFNVMPKSTHTESWFKPFWGYNEQWSQVYKNYGDMMKSMPLPLDSMADMSETMAKSVDSYVKIYDAWLKSTDKVAREGYEIGRKLNVGDNVDTSEFLNAMQTSYDDISASVIDVLNNTPFSGMSSINNAIKASLDSFPEEQQKSRDLMQEFLNFYVNTMNLSVSSMKEAIKTNSDMLEKGTISTDSFKSSIDAYGETLKNSIDAQKLPAGLLPRYKGLADDLTNIAKMNLDMYTSWVEVNLKLYQGMTKSSTEAQKSAEELLKDRKLQSPDEFYKLWTEAGQKATDIFIQNSQLDNSMPKVINDYTRWMQAVNKLYQDVITPAFTTEEDINKVSQELDNLKSSVEQKKQAAKTKSETTG